MWSARVTFTLSIHLYIHITAKCVKVTFVLKYRTANLLKLIWKNKSGRFRDAMRYSGVYKTRATTGRLIVKARVDFECTTCACRLMEWRRNVKTLSSLNDSETITNLMYNANRKSILFSCALNVFINVFSLYYDAKWMLFSLSRSAYFNIPCYVYSPNNHTYPEIKKAIKNRTQFSERAFHSKVSLITFSKKNFHRAFLVVFFFFHVAIFLRVA